MKSLCCTTKANTMYMSMYISIKQEKIKENNHHKRELAKTELITYTLKSTIPNKLKGKTNIK